ncbi:MAG: homoserine dehydrogenase [Actinobacteria bacterium]|nr:homoserine dehydrogenase [Actinomycetota bacterium]
MSISEFGVALLGFGTVGAGVYKLLHEGATDIQNSYPYKFTVRKVLVRDPEARRYVNIPKGLLAPNIDDILKDESIDIVVEAIGGIDPARSYIVESLKAGKDVVSANKKLFGKYGEKLSAEALRYGHFLGFAGAVTGFHQLCSSIINSVMIKSFSGVLNGTSNYVLTQMENGLPFEEALNKARANGYAEEDPSEDINGLDTRSKLVIATRLAFGKFLSEDDICVDGIKNITDLDIKFAKELGFAIKLLGLSHRVGEDKLYAVVGPHLVRLGQPLASVDGVKNGIQVFDQLRGIFGLVASGAGSEPTAMAIFTDLISIAKREHSLWPAREKNSRLKLAKSPPVCQYYLRLQLRNKAGVLAKVTKELGKEEINIEQITQRDQDDGAIVPVVIMCGPTEKKRIDRAIKRLKVFDFVSSDLLVLPVLEQLNEEITAG